MTTNELMNSIRTLLTTHYVTRDQLLALLNTDESIRVLKLSKPRLMQVLRDMVAKGEIEKTYKTDAYDSVRYRVPPVRYHQEANPDHAGTFQLVRRGDCSVVIGKGMTEAEARTCVTALNALDCKVRTIKGGR